MAQGAFRIVIDTNTLLRGLVGETSAAVKLLRAAEGRLVIPLLSKPVLDEYRAVLTDQALRERFPSLKPDLVEVTLRRLRFVGDYIRRPKVTFAYGRDPRDQKFVELAIALRATHVISSDRDLLELSDEPTGAGRRFRQRLPNVEVLDAAEFVHQHFG